jgi:hypothetical protein
MKGKPKVKLIYPLTVTADKIVVPVNIYDLSEPGRIFVLLGYIGHHKLATPETVKGYRATLKQLIQDENALFKLRIKIETKFANKLPQKWFYTNLGNLEHFYKINKLNTIGWGWGYEPIVDLLKNFKQFLIDEVLVSSSHLDYEISREISDVVHEFAIYMPYLKEQFKLIGSYGDGFCCIDCDGDFNTFVWNKIQHEIDMLTSQLRGLLIVSYPNR